MRLTLSSLSHDVRNKESELFFKNNQTDCFRLATSIMRRYFNFNNETKRKEKKMWTIVVVYS